MNDIHPYAISMADTYGLLDIESIKEIYNDIEIQENSENEIIKLCSYLKELKAKFYESNNSYKIMDSNNKPLLDAFMNRTGPINVKGTT